MPCYHPLKAYWCSGGVTFKKAESWQIPLQVPCGQCLGCRLERAKEWALRCHHEASLYPENSYITLTYNDQSIPNGGTLDKSHFQKFIRALRKKTGLQLRYYMCGEYGDESERPHYHALIFNFGFPDRYYWRTYRGNRFYRSPLLESLWTFGNSDISDVTFKSAGYVARYILKKQTGDRGAEHYGDRIPPYNLMSRRPGIGKKWYEKHKGDLFPHDYAVLPDGRQTTVPTYYRVLLAREDPELAAVLLAKRAQKASVNPDNTPERLQVRELIRQQKANRLLRTL